MVGGELGYFAAFFSGLIFLGLISQGKAKNHGTEVFFLGGGGGAIKSIQERKWRRRLGLYVASAALSTRGYKKLRSRVRNGGDGMD